MNCACHKMLKVFVQHGCTEIRLQLLRAMKAYSELAFVAGITNNLDQGHDLWYEETDIFVLFEEINNIMQGIIPSPCLKL